MDDTETCKIVIRDLSKQQLIAILRPLRISYQGTKQDCIARLQHAFRHDRDNVSRVIVDVFRSSSGNQRSEAQAPSTMYAAAAASYVPPPNKAQPAQPAQAAQPQQMSSVASNQRVAQAPATVGYIQQTAAMSQVPSRPAVVPQMARPANVPQHQNVRNGNQRNAAQQAAQNRTQPFVVPMSQIDITDALNFSEITAMEQRHGQGIIDYVKVLDGMVVRKASPGVNHFMAQINDPAILQGLGRMFKLQVRFLVYHPQKGNWVMPLIWPKESRLTVNDSVVFDTVTNNRLGFNSVGKKEPMPAVDITEFVPRGYSPSISISYFTSTAIPRETRWLVVAMVVRKCEEYNLVAEVRQRSPSDAACRARVDRYFSTGSTSEHGGLHEEAGLDIKMGKVTLSLKDPTSYGRIQHAARGRECDHLQCFDFKTYLTMNESARDAKWKCPLCVKPCDFRSLVLDAWFQKFINEYAGRNDVTGFTVHSSSNVEPIIEEEDDDDDNWSDEDTQPEAKRVRPSSEPAAYDPVQQPPVAQQAPPKPRTGRTPDEAILLLDDDDDLY